MYVGLSGPTLIHDTPQPEQNNISIETLLQPDGSLMLDVTEVRLSTASEMCRKTEKCPTRLSRDDER